MRASRRGLSLISMPYHAGRPEVGMGLGPKALLERYGLAEALGDDVEVEVVTLSDGGRPEIARTSSSRRLAERVSAARAAGRLPLVVAGNCNSCLGTAAGLGPRRGLGVVWFDAHGDFDTPKDNRSGFLDVMALSTLTGACWEALRRSIPGFREIAEQDVILVGVRDLEPHQHARIEGSRVQALFGDAIRWSSVEDVLEPALTDLRARAETVYLHVDLDVLDPSEGRANEYAAPGGLSLAELERSIRLVGSRVRVAGAAMTAYDPGCDPTGRVAQATLRVARAIRDAAG